MKNVLKGLVEERNSRNCFLQPGDHLVWKTEKRHPIINDDIGLLFYFALLFYRVNKQNNCLNTLGERDFALLEHVPGPRLAGTTDHQAILQGKSSSFSFSYT